MDATPPTRRFSETAIFAALALFVHSVGYIAVRSFVLMLHIPPPYYVESPGEYLIWGAKALAPLVLHTLLVFAVLVILLLLVEGARGHWKNYRKGVADKHSPMLAKVLEVSQYTIGCATLFIATIFFIVTCVVYWSPINACVRGALNWDWHEYISSLSEPLQGFNDSLAMVLALIIVIAIVGLWLMQRSTANADHTGHVTLLKFGIAIIGLACILIQAATFRAIYYNAHEEAQYQGKDVFVILERIDLGDRLLYAPGGTAFVVDANDTVLHRQRERIFENIFGDGRALVPDRAHTP